jgi:hypothetical protein
VGTDALFAPPGGAHTFDLEHRGTYLENFDEFIQVYTASHPKRQYSSKFHLINYFEEPVNLAIAFCRNKIAPTSESGNKSIPTLHLFV